MDERSSLGRLYDALAHERRRRLLSYLDATDDSVVSLAELADHCAASDSDPDEVAISLHHHHLPRLADADLLEYDGENRTVRQRSDAAAERLRSTAEEESGVTRR